MNVINGTPPNFDEILAAFPGADMPGVMFCWGDKIYAPGRTAVEDHFHAHEAVHAIQQGDDPAGWWKTYIASPQFRLEQEIPAHKAEMQFRFQNEKMNRLTRRRLVKEMAAKLAAPLYGSLISKGKARVALLG